MDARNDRFLREGDCHTPLCGVRNDNILLDGEIAKRLEEYNSIRPHAVLDNKNPDELSSYL